MEAWQFVLAALLTAILLALVATLLKPEWLQAQMEAERAIAAEWVGERRASEMLNRSKGWIEPLFAEEPAVSSEEISTFQTTLPLPGDMSDARQVFIQAVFRLLVMVYILVLTTPIIAAAAVDGVVIRMKKQEMRQSENPRVYHFAKKSLIAIVIAPIIIAILPLALGPYLALAWCALVACGVWGMAQNVEREI